MSAQLRDLRVLRYDPYGHDLPRENVRWTIGTTRYEIHTPLLLTSDIADLSRAQDPQRELQRSSRTLVVPRV